MAFDWKSLIDPAASLGGKVLGDKLAPSPDLMLAQNQQRQNEFNNQQSLAKMAQANQIRQMMLPGMAARLGLDPAKAQQYGAGLQGAPQQGGYQSAGLGTGTGQMSQPSKLASAGKTALGLGASLAPSIIGAIGKGAGAAVPAIGATTVGGGAGLGSAIAGLATNPFTIAGAGALTAGLLWKKSQAHPTADKWVQGEQNPFDASMANIDKAGLSPDQAKQAKQENAQRYLSELQAFAQKGGKEATVAKQAADTFRQWYGDPMQYGVRLMF